MTTSTEAYLFFLDAVAVTAPAGAFISLLHCRSTTRFCTSHFRFPDAAVVTAPIGASSVFPHCCNSDCSHRSLHLYFPIAVAEHNSAEATFSFRCRSRALLISNNWKYSTHSPLCNYNSFESHAITVIAPIKLQIVIIYRPPGQIIAPFLEELDRLWSSFMEDGTPLLVFGDFNIHLEKPYAIDFHSLLASFDLKRLTTTSTHKSGNQLDLIDTRNCTADNILVQPLHISDHFFIQFTLHYTEIKWRKSNDTSDLSIYHSLLSSFSTEVHTVKSSHFHNKINSASDMRNLFRTFNYLLCPPSTPPTTSITADDFATFFTDKTKTISSQFSPPLTQDLQPTRCTAQNPIFSFCPLTEAEVFKLLLSSHPTTCPLDPIPSHLLQAISPTLLPALTHIINTSLLTGIFPAAFKQARVTPLLKKPTLNTSLIENYRPVCLIPFIAKTLKLVVSNQVLLFVSQNNKLDAEQSGFRSRHSTETALLSVTEALRIAKANSKSSVLILLDLSATFDTVNHQILLSTLSSMDITGIPLRWFESYLTGRSFRVAWGGEVSKAHQLVTGVPQGSVLGPLVFSTYTTSLGPIIQAHGFS